MNSSLWYKELTSVLSNLKLKKSSGPDAITNEMIVNLGQPSLHKLLDIFNKTWHEGTLPNLLASKQPGFREHHCTEDQTTYLAQEIEDGFQHKKNKLSLYGSIYRKHLIQFGLMACF